MIRRSPLVRSLVVLGTASLALAACGGSSTSSSSSTSAAASSASASASESASASASASGGGSATCDAAGALKVGGLLPQTGSLAFLGPPEFAGVELAVKEINAAGGANGGQVQWIPGDSGDTSTNIASQTVDREIAQGVGAIIGAASSSVTLSVIDKVTSSGVLQISPANTSVVLSTYPDKGLYFRTAPPDTFQGAVLGDLVAKDGHTNAAIMALQDAYGEGLANAFDQNYTAAGGQTVSKIIYDPKAASFEAEVGKTKAANPQAIVLIGFDESKKILAELIKQGIGPDKVPLYLVDGNLSNTLADGLPAGIMKGTKGTTPGAAADEAFKKALLTQDPKLTDFSYAPESYDAMNIVALASLLAKSSCGTDIAKQMVAATSGGEACTDFATCKAIFDKGGDFDYNGRSGPTDLADNGDPKKATMGVYEFGADNKYTRIDSVTGDVPPADAGESPSASAS